MRAEVNAVWGWYEPAEARQVLYCDFNHRKSTVDTYKLHGPDRVPDDEGRVVINAKRHSASRVLSFVALNCASPIRLLRKRYAERLLEFSGSDQIQLFPATVEAKDFVIDDYVVVIPLHELVATDVDKSDIRHWAEPGVFALEYTRLTFNPNCLGDLKIARDTLTGVYVVSDEFKKFVQTWDNTKGFYMVDGSEISTWPYR